MKARVVIPKFNAMGMYWVLSCSENLALIGLVGIGLVRFSIMFSWFMVIVWAWNLLFVET